jgi:hypothetical protein
MNIALAEKRREARRPAQGMVHLKLRSHAATEIVGRLLDLSENGFRMGHTYTPLTSGQVVDFRHTQASGAARVVWNRILADRVETGFFILSSPTE